MLAALAAAMYSLLLPNCEGSHNVRLSIYNKINSHGLTMDYIAHKDLVNISGVEKTMIFSKSKVGFLFFFGFIVFFWFFVFLFF